MNARAINAAAGVILASMQRKQTAAGIAADVEAAGLLMSPETAAELETLRSTLERRTALLRDVQAMARSSRKEADGRKAHAERLKVSNLEAAERAQKVIDELRKRVAELEAAVLPPWWSQMTEEVSDVLSELASAALSYYSFETTEDPQQRFEAAMAWGHREVSERLADEAGKVTPTGGEITQPDELTVYRASHDAIVMGLYTTRDAAEQHCLASADNSDLHNAVFAWHDDEDGSTELWATLSPRSMPERPTGYVVTPVPVASEYDEEADE
ncbi:hypothetical protein [Streptomyces sp. MI02-7b]|uniref:hypothetical protein n=1 Tax=Streptomyces sp. MI02-7b TaxID=462941 RepID=UPI0029B93225|nr:hypothetical protein [Streptomyces sp. MI02-7b]MDX3074582.1 hypothetical protein [Streptomyces sp. MI02-7b]